MTKGNRGDVSAYPYYANAYQRYHHKYTLPVILKILDSYRRSVPNLKIFDLGCGNGSVAATLTEKGYDIMGVDTSAEGIQQAQAAYPHLKLAQGSAYDDLSAKYGQFPIVLSLEVVEHLYFPRKYAACIYSLLPEGEGTAIISTPYHGYWKNLAMAVTGKMDSHFTALWDYGHIKFWSFNTLRSLLLEAGFKSVEFKRAGRIPALAKAMIAIAKK